MPSGMLFGNSLRQVGTIWISRQGREWTWEACLRVTAERGSVDGDTVGQCEPSLVGDDFELRLARNTLVALRKFA